MPDVHKITKDSQMRSLKGLDLAALTALIQPFAESHQAEIDSLFSLERLRQRRAGAGRKSVLAAR